MDDVVFDARFSNRFTTLLKMKSNNEVNTKKTKLIKTSLQLLFFWIKLFKKSIIFIQSNLQEMEQLRLAMESGTVLLQKNHPL